MNKTAQSNELHLSSAPGTLMFALMALTGPSALPCCLVAQVPSGAPLLQPSFLRVQMLRGL